MSHLNLDPVRDRCYLKFTSSWRVYFLLFYDIIWTHLGASSSKTGPLAYTNGVFYTQPPYTAIYIMQFCMFHETASGQPSSSQWSTIWSTLTEPSCSSINCADKIVLQPTRKMCKPLSYKSRVKSKDLIATLNSYYTIISQLPRW